MKKMKFITSILTMTLIGSSLLPAATMFAASNNDSQTSTTIDNDLDFYKNSKYFTVKSQGEDTIITISDQNLVAYMSELGMDVPVELQRMAMSRAAGVTKIVWHGQARYGNVDLYLSQTWLNNCSKMGTSAIVGALGLIIKGGGWGVAFSSISSVVSSGNHKHGRVFVIKKFNMSYWYYQ